MVERISHGIEILPKNAAVKQLFVLLHGAGANSADLQPLAYQFRNVFPHAVFLIPDGPLPFHGGQFDGAGHGRQWFPVSGVTEENRPERVAAAMPALHALVRDAQQRYQVLQSDTALVGFSQGAIMALEFSVAHDGHAGRVIAFSGRFARLPETAPELTTLHLLHGEEDRVIQVEQAYAAYDRLMELQGDATLDVASSVGHEIHAALAERALHRLQTCIPLRSWKQALGGA